MKNENRRGFFATSAAIVAAMGFCKPAAARRPILEKKRILTAPNDYRFTLGPVQPNGDMDILNSNLRLATGWIVRLVEPPKESGEYRYALMTHQEAGERDIKAYCTHLASEKLYVAV